MVYPLPRRDKKGRKKSRRGIPGLRAYHRHHRTAPSLAPAFHFGETSPFTLVAMSAKQRGLDILREYWDVPFLAEFPGELREFMDSEGFPGSQPLSAFDSRTSSDIDQQLEDLRSWVETNREGFANTSDKENFDQDAEEQDTWVDQCFLPPPLGPFHPGGIHHSDTPSDLNEVGALALPRWSKML